MTMTRDEIENFLATEFPQIEESGVNIVVEAVEGKHVRLRLPYDPQHLRPGGTLSGPSQMALADLAVYVAVIAAIGPVVGAVTTSLNANFLRRPAPKDLIAEAQLLKLGRRLAVGEVNIFSDGEDEPVCHVTATYSIPPRPDLK